MSESPWLGTLLVLLGGSMTGSFTLPMKFIRRWEWENIWFIYSIVGLLLLPWTAAFITCPNFLPALGATPATILCLTAFFGFGWGIANVLFGLSVAMIGMAISFALVSGLNAAFGSLLPLILLTPQRLGTPGGYMTFLGVALTVAGVAALGVSGRMREKARSTAGSPESMRLGILLCVIAGLLAPMLNFSFVFGAPIAANAVSQGASKGNASYAIWAVGLFGAFLANAGYALFKLFQTGALSRYGKSGIEWLLSALTGILFTMGFLLYGRGVTVMGDLGPSVGWPVFQATTILVATMAGVLSGEWRNSSARVMTLTIAGLMLLMAAIAALSIANRM